jgi:NTP pyrophosphatase (non-canonical NTP hydrolase)
MNLNDYGRECHAANIKWWVDLQNPCAFCVGAYTDDCAECHDTGFMPKDRNTGELLMLIVSELAEAMEGHRKDLQDDKLPHRKMFEVELADALIRIFDLAGARGLDLQGAYEEKMAFNAQRADHKIEQRQQAGGKKY